MTAQDLIEMYKPNFQALMENEALREQTKKFEMLAFIHQRHDFTIQESMNLAIEIMKILTDKPVESEVQ